MSIAKKINPWGWATSLGMVRMGQAPLKGQLYETEIVLNPFSLIQIQQPYEEGIVINPTSWVSKPSHREVK